VKQIELSHPADYAGWRCASRQLLLDDVPPEALVWNAGGVMQDLFSDSSGDTSASTDTPSTGNFLTRTSAIGTSSEVVPSVVTPLAGTPTEGSRSASYRSMSAPSEGSPSIASPSKSPLHVPQEFLSMAEYAVCHRAPERFALLYRVLWRVMRGERTLFNRDTDDDMHRLHELRKAVVRARSSHIEAKQPIFQKALYQYALVDLYPGRKRALGWQDYGFWRSRYSFKRA